LGWGESGVFVVATVGTFDDANQNRRSNHQDAVDRVEFAVHVVGYL